MKRMFGVAITLRRVVNIAAVTLVLAGIAVLAFPAIGYWLERHQGVQANSQFWQNHARADQPAGMVLGVPESIRVPRLKVGLTLLPGQYNQQTQQWVLNSTNAFYVLPGTSPLSPDATPLIYGHYRRNVFENLDGIAANEPMYITNRAGKTLLFRFVGKSVLSPEQGKSLVTKPSDGKSLDVLTCVPPFYTMRHIYHFQYVTTLKGTALGGRS